MTTTLLTKPPITAYRPEIVPESITKPEELTEQEEGRTFYIVTTLAGVTMFLLAIASVALMVYYFVIQAG